MAQQYNCGMRTGHNINWEEAEIVYGKNSGPKKKIKESLTITTLGAFTDWNLQKYM